MKVELPFVLILTHLKGALVWAVQGEDLFDLDNVDLDSPPQNISFSLCIGSQTTETLSDLFEKALQKNPFKTLMLGVGPYGSFTGLRLGCSFCNGLIFPFIQTQAKYYAIPTLPYGDEITELSDKHLIQVLESIRLKTVEPQQVLVFEPQYFSLPKVKPYEV